MDQAAAEAAATGTDQAVVRAASGIAAEDLFKDEWEQLLRRALRIERDIGGLEAEVGDFCKASR